VERDTFNAARIARDRLLALPTRIAPKIVGETDIRQIIKIMQDEIRETLSNLADFLHGYKKE